MYHIIIFLLLSTTFFVSVKYQLFSENIHITLVLTSIVALFRFFFERDILISENMLKQAKDMENKPKEFTHRIKAKCTQVFEEEQQVLTGFHDFIFVLEDGTEKIYSTSKPKVIKAIRNNVNKELVMYVNESFIVAVEEPKVME